MKYLALAMACAALAGCAADGSFDAAAFRSISDASLGIYDRYDRAQRPTHYPTLYDAYGNPIQGPPY